MFKLTPEGLESSPIDSRKLRNYIETAVGKEISLMAQDCYYPKISRLFKELMHRTDTSEKELRAYSKSRYTGPQSKYKLLHDTHTTLLILITQHFMNEKKDMAGAMWTFHLFALRMYSNLMHRFLPQGCIPEYYRAALERLSHSHLFRKKSTIGNSILYLSNATFKKHEKGMRNDDPEVIWKMIYSIRTRIAQSMKSFYSHYYQAKEDKERISSKSEEDLYGEKSLDDKKRAFAQKVSKDMTIYSKKDANAERKSRDITKFNRQLGHMYTEAVTNPNYQEKIELIIGLMLRPIKDLNIVCGDSFLIHIKKLMAVKTSNKPVYFKKVLVELHDNHIIPSLGLNNWFNKISLQTKKQSRDFLAYYIALFVRAYLCS